MAAIGFGQRQTERKYGPSKSGPICFNSAAMLQSQMGRRCPTRRTKWRHRKRRWSSSPGTHDHGVPGATGSFTCFGANAGPSGFGYYSFDVGSWHIAVLNSSIATEAGSPQEVWVRADLAANPSVCTLAYWHFRRFSPGDHGNWTRVQDLWPTLYDNGVDVVLYGHDHHYERFAPQPGASPTVAIGAPTGTPVPEPVYAPLVAVAGRDWIW